MLFSPLTEEGLAGPSFVCLLAKWSYEVGGLNWTCPWDHQSSWLSWNKWETEGQRGAAKCSGSQKELMTPTIVVSSRALSLHVWGPVTENLCLDSKEQRAGCQGPETDLIIKDFKSNPLLRCWLEHGVGRIMALPETSISLCPKAVNKSPHMAKGTLRMWLRLRDFRWGYYLDGPNLITGILKSREFFLDGSEMPSYWPLDGKMGMNRKASCQDFMPFLRLQLYSKSWSYWK